MTGLVERHEVPRQRLASLRRFSEQGWHTEVGFEGLLAAPMAVEGKSMALGSRSLSCHEIEAPGYTADAAKS